MREKTHRFGVRSLDNPGCFPYKSVCGINEAIRNLNTIETIEIWLAIECEEITANCLSVIIYYGYVKKEESFTL